MPTTDTDPPSGVHRNWGRGVGTLKIDTDSPIRVDWPPSAETRKSAASCEFLARFGVDVT